MIAQDIQIIVDHNLEKEQELLRLMAEHWEKLYHLETPEEKITHFDVEKLFHDLANALSKDGTNKSKKSSVKKEQASQPSIAFDPLQNRISLSTQHLNPLLVTRFKKAEHYYWENVVYLILYEYHDDTTHATVRWDLSRYQDRDVFRLLSAIIQEDLQLSEEVLYIARRLEESHREQNRLMLEKWTLWAKQEYGDNYESFLSMIQQSSDPPEELKHELDEEEDDPEWGVFVENDIYGIPDTPLPDRENGESFSDRYSAEYDEPTKMNDVVDDSEGKENEIEDDDLCDGEENEERKGEDCIYAPYKEEDSEIPVRTLVSEEEYPKGEKTLVSEPPLADGGDLKKKKKLQRKKVKAQKSPFIETLQGSSLHAFIYSDGQRKFILELISQGYLPVVTFWGKGSTTHKHWNTEPYHGRHGDGFRMLTSPLHKHRLIHVTYFIRKGKK